MEAMTNSSTEPLCIRTSYARSLSCVDDKLRSFRSCLRWIRVDQSDARHAIVSCSLFLLPGIFIPTASHFVLSCALAHRAYDVMV
ncbi:hypothetical protein BHM03_00055408 [Ensete ventricosum]|uniref:Uncharacterized protein n=1 Tax=Ensete ventricosum TaxID=4639 RepID=A0A445MM96_ENSVE|nr:hypothetical protein BHM03_00055408 [Ensete ventricosum]